MPPPPRGSPLLDPHPARSTAAAVRALALRRALDPLDAATKASPTTPSATPAATLETVLSLLHDAVEWAASAG